MNKILGDSSLSSSLLLSSPFLHKKKKKQLELFRLGFCLREEQSAELPCAAIQVLSLAQTRRRTLSTFVIRLPVYEQRGFLGMGIIEEIMQYLLFFPLLPGSFQVFTAVRANYPAEKWQKTRERKITKPMSSTNDKLAKSLCAGTALMVLTRETQCVFDLHSERKREKKETERWSTKTLLNQK